MRICAIETALEPVARHTELIRTPKGEAMSAPLTLDRPDPRRVALVHDWLITDRGGERGGTHRLPVVFLPDGTFETAMFLNVLATGS